MKTVFSVIFGFLAGFGLILSASTSREITMWFDEMHTFWAWMGITGVAGLFFAFAMPKIIDSIFIKVQ